MPANQQFRNVAVIAHIDHGKTTLCDAMLKQSGAWSDHQEIVDRVLDSSDLERERGITISASTASIQYEGVKINILDTPGHADFSADVERSLYSATGCLFLVDAAEGPLAQSRTVLRKALEARLPIIVVVNKIDRPDARIEEVLNEVYELFLDLDADEEQIEFPIVYASARNGTATLEEGATGENLVPLFETILSHVPAPEYDEQHPLQVLVTDLDASPYLGRLAIGYIKHGTLNKGDTVAWCRDGQVSPVKITELYITDNVTRTSVDSAPPGEIIALAGLGDVTIGETLADLNDPRPLPALTVDEPSMGMTIGTNTSPLAGKSGKKLTARMIKDRLDQELLGNVSLNVLDTERPDTWEVQGRGELQLAVLVETMRREGFELTIGKPQVVTKEIDGKLHEPLERVEIDVPEEFMGVVTQLLAVRKGKMEQMVNHNTGWVRLEFTVPARGLLGFRTEFLTETRGTGILNHSQEGYAPWFGNLRTRQNGTLVADRKGIAAAFSIFRLQERGLLFVLPTEEVYEGMIVGENARDEDMAVDVSRSKAQTNIRSSGADEAIKLVPATRFSLEQCLDFLDDDEFLEVTPDAIRLRKMILNTSERLKAKKKSKS